jgi:hypothetical protein
MEARRKSDVDVSGIEGLSNEGEKRIKNVHYLLLRLAFQIPFWSDKAPKGKNPS